MLYTVFPICGYMNCYLYLFQDLLISKKFHGEGLKVPGNTNPPNVGAAAYSQNATIDVSPFATNATGGTPIQRLNGKYPPLSYPSLGGTVVANYARGVNGTNDLKNPTQYKYGAYSREIKIMLLNRVLVHTLKGRKEEGITLFNSFLPCLVYVLRSNYPWQLLMV